MRHYIGSTKSSAQLAAMLVSIAVAFLITACGDFFNSKSTGTPGSAPVQTRERPSVNPFPPGFENPNEGPFSEAKMLVNIGVNVIAKSVDDFALEAKLLERRLEQACTTSPSLDEKALSSAKEQWTRTMLSYHRIDSYPVGPLWANGRKIASQIYSWPMLNTCGIDGETVKRARGEATPVSDLPVPTRGLAAIEYLLFEPSLTTRCNARVFPRVTEWAAGPDGEKRQARCHQARAISKDVSELATSLSDEWNPSGRNFTRALIDGSDPAFKTVKDATNALTDSLFQIETVKDARLGKPLGRHGDCTSPDDKCPERVEHPYSGLALASVTARLTAFREGFTGGAGFGLDDLLADRGQPEAANRVVEAVNQALAAVPEGASLKALIEAMDPAACHETTSTNRKVEICGLFQDVRAITTLLKTDVLPALALRAPPTYQGDND